MTGEAPIAGSNRTKQKSNVMIDAMHLVCNNVHNFFNVCCTSCSLFTIIVLPVQINNDNKPRLSDFNCSMSERNTIAVSQS